MWLCKILKSKHSFSSKTHWPYRNIAWVRYAFSLHTHHMTKHLVNVWEGFGLWNLMLVIIQTSGFKRAAVPFSPLCRFCFFKFIYLFLPSFLLYFSSLMCKHSSWSSHHSFSLSFVALPFHARWPGRFKVVFQTIWIQSVWFYCVPQT